MTINIKGEETLAFIDAATHWACKEEFTMSTPQWSMKTFGILEALACHGRMIEEKQFSMWYKRAEEQNPGFIEELRSLLKKSFHLTAHGQIGSIRWTDADPKVKPVLRKVEEAAQVLADEASEVSGFDLTSNEDGTMSIVLSEILVEA